jgi:hypothetical protein
MLNAEMKTSNQRLERRLLDATESYLVVAEFRLFRTFVKAVCPYLRLDKKVRFIYF